MIKGVQVAFYLRKMKAEQSIKKLLDIAYNTFVIQVTVPLYSHLFIKDKIVLLLESEVLEKVFLT